MAQDPRIGTTLSGYEIEEVVARGGMGIVYRARQERLGRAVAVKVIAPELASDVSFRARFEREARLAASIEHPHALPVYGAGETDDGELYIATRFIEGTDLHELLEQKGRLAPERAARLISQVAGALDDAHRAGLVHRDIKPANILVSVRPEGDHAYLTDFGLTKRTGSTGGLTKTDQWVGTVDFVAPEQIEGGEVDGRADVYALGCVLHQALTGKPPFARDSDVAVMWAHINEPPPSPSEECPEVPEAFDDVIAAAMVKDPEQRIASAGELGRLAVAAAGGTSDPTVAGAAAAAATVASGPTPQGPGDSTPAPRTATPVAATAQLPEPDGGGGRGQGGRIALIVSGLLAAVVGGLFAAGVFSGDDESGAEQASASSEAAKKEERRIKKLERDLEELQSTTTTTSAAPETSSAPDGFTTYASSGGGWQANVPTGGGWSEGTETQLNPGLHRTTFNGPNGAVLLVDSTPGETPRYTGEGDRSTVPHPVHGSMERIVFRGDTSVTPCETAQCVDYLIPVGSGGYGVLAGGPGSFGDLASVAETVALSIR